MTYRIPFLIALFAAALGVAGPCPTQLNAYSYSHELSLSDRDAIRSALTKTPVETSNLNFTNLWGWHPLRNYRVSMVQGSVLISANSDPSQRTYLEPYGVSAPEKARIIVEALVDSRERGESARFVYISKEVAELLRLEPLYKFEIHSDPDGEDFLYSVNDLTKKAGQRYQQYRTELNQFSLLYPSAKFVSFQDDASLLDRAIQYNREWLSKHKHREDPILKAEVNAANRILSDYALLELFGGALIVDDKLVAYGVGESINRNTAVFHFLKGSETVRGSNSAIMDEMVRNSPAGTGFINLQEDLGYPGLRKHKESINPCRKIEKNTVQWLR